MKLKILFLSILLAAASYCVFIFFTASSSFNFATNSTISRGIGWKNNQSNYAGSEMDFVFNNSNKISFEFDTDSKADQGAEIIVDNISYFLQSPNLSNQNLTISVNKNKSHSVTIRHFCTRFNYPCQIHLKSIGLEKNTKLWAYKLHNKILTILGDSISTIYGKDNYSQILANSLGYELHNASIVQSSVSKVNKIDSAISRYKKDLLKFKSDIVIIFMGTNDAGNNVNIDQFKNDYERIIKDLKEFNPDAKIFLLGLLPRTDLNENTLQEYDIVIKNLSDKYGAVYIDTTSWLTDSDFSDNLHPSITSQVKIAENIKRIIEANLK